MDLEDFIKSASEVVGALEEANKEIRMWRDRYILKLPDEKTLERKYFIENCFSVTPFKIMVELGPERIIDNARICADESFPH